MSKKNRIKIFFSLLILFIMTAGLNQFAFAGEYLATKSDTSIHIDIPVVLKKANVVFNMDHLAFAGDVPVGIKYMHLLANRYKEMDIKGQIIGIFHGDAAYVTLNDEAYNAYRNVRTGNPYKTLIAELIGQGVQIEECAVSMKSHRWVNQNLLPGVKVNTGAVARLIQLIQEGYVQIQP
ncbi:MAG: DsrE family protein [Bacteroidetes bacterium]|nr:DsrE family protein [Bacteroidota bacterium]